MLTMAVEKEVDVYYIKYLLIFNPYYITYIFQIKLNNLLFTGCKKNNKIFI